MSLIMMRRFLWLLFLSISFVSVVGQMPWPEVKQETKPWTRWWWQGNAVNKEELSRLLKLYNGAGLGGVEITPIYGVKGAENQFIDFLSPKWMDMLAHTLKEASNLGMGVDMATGTGWPFGGPWISYEDACKQVVYRNWTIKKGEKIADKIEMMQQPMLRGTHGGNIDLKNLKDPYESNPNLQALAVDQVKFEKPLPCFLVMAYPLKEATPIDLTKELSPNGQLNWTASEDCEVYAFFMGWHGKMVERAAPGGEGNVIDHFSKKAIDVYFKKFNDAFAGKDISSLRGFFNDSYEVDDARGQSNWTPEFFSEFKKRRGYDLQPYMPAVFGKSKPELNERILFDYRETISELLLDNFTIPWANWAKQNKAMVRNQSHGSPGNTMDLYAAVDIPETEGEDILRFKFATSAANVTGKPLVSAEACTWLGDHFVSSLADVKHAMDKYFVGGVNHIVYHGTNYSPAGDAWPGWLFYAAVHFHPNNPFWRQFPAVNKYVERCQSFLQAGKPNNDVLIYYPYADAQMERGRDLLKHYDAMRPEFTNTGFNEISSWMLANGYAFDFISDKQLKGVQNNGAGLATGGVNYQAMLLPANKYIPVATLLHLMKLVENGATLMAYKELPKDVPGYAGHKEGLAQLQQLFSALKFSASGGVQVAAYGKGKVILASDASSLLQSAGVRQESMSAMGLQFARRSYKNGAVYFITNPTADYKDAYVKLAVSYANATLYNPMTGETGKATCRKHADGSLEVLIQLPAGESVIVYASNDVVQGAAYPVYEPTGNAKPLTGTWKVKFEEGGTILPAEKQISELSPWTTWQGEGYGYFSGTASYTLAFKRPKGKVTYYRLSLGKVAESCDVWINGSKVATLVGPDYSFILPAGILKKLNQLTIYVSNSMANRIIEVDKSGANWKKFYNTNFPARLAENRGADGLFTPAKWSPRISGLLGPVTLTPMKLK
jgi:hypothetical protein